MASWDFIMKKQINKLVRDNIPNICKNNMQTPIIRILDDKEYTTELKRKLKEEVSEYFQTCEIEELADIVEVIEALAKIHDSSFEEVLEIKRKKQHKNGAFNDKIYLISVEDQINS